MRRHWTAEERAAAEEALGQLVASGIFGASSSEVRRTFNSRWSEIRSLAGEPAKIATFAFMAEIDRAVPGASAKIFPISLEVIQSQTAGTA
jgi:hypothetical protein